MAFATYVACSKLATMIFTCSFIFVYYMSLPHVYRLSVVYREDNYIPILTQVD